jgi:hypothetical protein
MSVLLAVVVSVGVEAFGHLTAAGHVAVRDPVASCLMINVKLVALPDATGLLNVNVVLPVKVRLKIFAVLRSTVYVVVTVAFTVVVSLYALILLFASALAEARVTLPAESRLTLFSAGYVANTSLVPALNVTFVVPPALEASTVSRDNVVPADV